MFRYREIIEECVDDGWTPSRITGSHLVMTKEKKRSVPIPLHATGGIHFQKIRKQLKQSPPEKKAVKSTVTLPKTQPIRGKNIRPKIFESSGEEVLLSKEESIAHKKQESKEISNLASKAFNTLFLEHDYDTSIACCEQLTEDPYDPYSSSAYFRRNFFYTYACALGYRAKANGFSPQFVVDMLQAYYYFKDDSLDENPLAIEQAEYILDIFVMSMEQYYRPNYSSLLKLELPYLKAIVESVYLVVTKREHDKIYLNTYCIVGYQFASTIARKNPPENVSYFEMAYNFLILGKDKTGFDNIDCIQRFAMIVLIHYENKVLGNCYFSKKENMEELMELAGVNIDSQFTLEVVKFKNKFLVENKTKRYPTSVVEQLVEDFNMLEPQPDCLEYVQLKLAVFWNAFACYCDHIDMIETDKAQFFRNLARMRELFDWHLPAIAKIQEIGSTEEIKEANENFQINLGNIRYCSAKLFQGINHIMSQVILCLSFFKMKRNITRGYSRDVYSIKNEFKSELALAEKEKQRIKELANQKTYNKDEIAFCMQFLTLIVEFKRRQKNDDFKLYVPVIE